MKDLVNDGFAKVVKPYIDAQNKKDRELVAPVEVSPAEAAHSLGDQIIFNGLLYNVTAQIAVGDSLSASGAGANISAADNIEAQIKTTKSQIQTAAAQAASQNKNTQEMLAPVEEDETDASRAYEVGDQLIFDGILYIVIDPIAQHGIITTEGAGANIEEADTITEQLANANVTPDPVPTSGSTKPVQSGGVYSALQNKANTSDLGTAAAKNSTTSVTSGSGDLVTSGGVHSALQGKADAADLGTAAAKNSTSAVTSGSTDLVESGAVYSALDLINDAVEDLSDSLGTVTTKTLAANATSISFDVPTSGNNLIDFYISDGSWYTAIDTSVSGTVTLTFDAVASARTISCRIGKP